MNEKNVRLVSIELLNYKNVTQGKLEMPCAANRDFSCDRSEILGIYGQNGSGKTTVIEALSLTKFLLSGMPLPKEAADDIAKNAESVDWENDPKTNPNLERNYTDITIPILKALDGIEPMRIVASRPNYGAIAGMPEMAAVEYSMDLYKDTITPVENLYIPSPFKGLIASLSEFQTLQADAIAQQDPALFGAALDAYPVNQFSSKRKEFFSRMFDAYDDLDPMWRKSLDYLC